MARLAVGHSTMAVRQSYKLVMKVRFLLALPVILFLAWSPGLGSTIESYSPHVQRPPVGPLIEPTVVPNGWRFSWEIVAEGFATYFGPYFSTGEHKTATGTVYRPDAGIVALPKELFQEWKGYQVRVTNLENGASWMLSVQDTGEGLGWPYVADLPDKIFEDYFQVPLSKGIFPVRIEVGIVR